MAVEQKRGCGYRKVGGLYLVSGGIGAPCDRLPYALDICPCCGQGIKKARGWTWVNVNKLFQGAHTVSTLDLTPIDTGIAGMTMPHVGGEKVLCGCAKEFCPLCNHPEMMGRAGLLWIGEKFYKTPDQFVQEGVEMGFSRRITTVPHGFKIGETWVLLAHKNAVPEKVHSVADGWASPSEVIPAEPGIFFVWQPQRVELIFKESQRGSEKVQAAVKRGITPVFVPDNDKDHQGNVHDDFDREQKDAE